MSLGQVNRGFSVLGLATAARMAPIPPPGPEPIEPKLEIAWRDFHWGFFSSIRALLTWPLVSRKFLGGDSFRDCWVELRIPKRALLAAALWHVVFLLSPISLLNTVVRHHSAFDNTRLTWSGPMEDFPTLEIAAKPKPKTVSPTAAHEPLPPRGADAFHPRQRIVTDPVRPNHPRQTLVHPRAPDIAPKRLPDLPNIVQFEASAGPARPRIEINAAALARLRPRQRRVAAVKETPLPDAPTFEQKPSEITLTGSTNGPARPKLELNAGATPRVAEHAQTGDSLPAPELGKSTAAGGNPNSLIALSATPAPPRPEVVAPEGNLAARLAISPEGQQPGVPNGSPTTTADAATSMPASLASNRTGNSPVGISISGGNPQPKNPVPGVGHAVPKISPSSTRALAARPDSGRDASHERTSPPNFAALPPGAKPEQVFASKHVYTLAVNMANLNSASGSWIWHFAELGSSPGVTPSVSADLSMPVPMRKVDPKYPPELIEQNVQGEVVLYAIVRADGFVDSIQVVRGVDAQLDTNAKSAFAQWKFTPAIKAGTPVDLEVIAYIPFKIRDDR